MFPSGSHSVRLMLVRAVACPKKLSVLYTVLGSSIALTVYIKDICLPNIAKSILKCPPLPDIKPTHYRVGSLSVVYVIVLEQSTSCSC
jgi:hypothetical protein